MQVVFFHSLRVSAQPHGTGLKDPFGDARPGEFRFRRYEMYAIIATGGKQYRVAEGDVIRVEKIDLEEGASYEFTEVLAVGDEEMTVGTPTVPGAVVKATVEAQGKAKKVIVYKYKRKSGYHKKQGHRQLYTQFKINEIVK